MVTILTRHARLSHGESLDTFSVLPGAGGFLIDTLQSDDESQLDEARYATAVASSSGFRVVAIPAD